MDGCCLSFMSICSHFDSDKHKTVKPGLYTCLKFCLARLGWCGHSVTDKHSTHVTITMQQYHNSNDINCVCCLSARTYNP